jgi:hypothetical protein
MLKMLKNAHELINENKSLAFTFNESIQKASIPDPYPSISRQKKLRKTLISTVLWFLNDLLSLKTDVNVPTENNWQKTKKKIIFCWHLECHWRKGQDLGPDPYPDL